MSSLEHARALVAEAGRVATFTGAGLSAESGIATFRDPTTGYWARYDPAELASPVGFAADPELVIDWYNHRRRTLAAAEPNAAHRSLAECADLIHVTQNVDDLLERAGARRVLHLHGSIGLDRCDRACGYEERIDLAAPPGLRPCPFCGAPIRPAVVWFGETLQEAVWNASVEAISRADLLLVIGTSGVVYPAAGLIDHARSTGAAVVVVNAEPIRSPADVVLIGSAVEFVPEILAGRRTGGPGGSPGSDVGRLD
jgi:NAD-dependent deacetylase